MVAVVSGNGLGLFTTSLAQLGLAGGGPSIGGSRTDQYVNLATGNLVLTGWDESLFGHGFATGLVRTYNSQGSFAQTGTDGWQTGYERTVRLASGTKNTVGSTVERATADGSVVTYTWDAARSAYVSSQGEGAHDTIVLSGSGSSAKWLWTEGGTQVQETYTASSLAVAGKLEKVVDLATKATYTLSYSGTLLQSVAGTNGETLTFGYDDQNRLISLGTSERDAGGVLVTKGQVSYGYDAAGRLSWVQTDLTPENALDNTWNAGAPANNDGKSYRVAYTYADASSLRITGVATSDGITVAYTYDASGRIASVTQGGVADGSAQSLTYAYSAGATTVTDAAGRSWTYQYDAAGQLTAVLEPAVGGQRAVTDYSYDAAGNVVRIRQAAYAGATSTLDTVYQYDANGNVILQRDLLGNTVVRTYSSENRVLTEARYTVPDADGLDPTHAGTVNVPGDALVTRYVYDTTNPRLLRFVIDAAGRVTETQYNASGVAQGLASMTRSFVGAMYDTSGLPVSGVPTLTEMTDWATAGRGQTARTDFSYDAQGRLSQRTDYATVSSSSGAGVLDDATSITRYTYDAQGLLRQQVAVHGVGRTVAGVAPGGSEVVDYVYDGLGRLLSTIRRSSETAANDDANIVTTTVAYVDSSRRVVTTLDSGLVRTEVRNAAGLLLSLSEAGTVAGAQVTRTTQSVYDATGRLRAVQDATGGLTYFFYDAAGRLSATVDATGAVTKTLYDAIGRVSGSVSYATRVATTGWYSAGAVVKDELVYAAVAPALSGTQAWVQTDAANDRTATRAYDAAGRLASETDAAGLVTSYAYDGAGRLLSSTESGDGASRVKRFFYDATDRLVATLDAGGFLVEMIYDAAGRLALTKRYATRTNNAYWQNGTLDQLRPLADAANDQVEHLLYDGRGNQVGLVDAEGYLTEFLYDEKNNQRVVKAYAKKLTGLTGSETLAILRTSAMQSPPAEPYRLTQRSFNGLGQVVVELNPEGTVTRYSYDEAGRLVRTEAGQGTSEVRENYLRYDVFGQVTGEMSGQQAADAAAMLGKSLDDPGLSEAQRESAYAQYGLRHSYDLLGRRTETVDASGAKTFYFYDAQGRQTFVVRGVKANGIANALGEVTETRYTAFGQVGEVLVYTGRIAIAQPGVRASVQSAISTLSFVAATDARRQYAYDRRGLLTRLIDAEGVQTAMSYNAFGELAEQTTAYGTGQASTTRYAYNPRGQMNSRTEAYGTALARATTQTFDAFGRVATVTDALGSVTTLTYDRRGRQVGMSRTVSGQLESTSTAYDAFDRVVSQADARGYVTTYAHSDSARSLVVTTPEGVSVTTVHNRFGQTVTVSQALPGGGTATATTTYDRNGAVVSVLDPLGNSTGNVYDVRGLLTEATDASGRKVQYTYDAVGRQLTRVEDPGAGKLNLTTTYTYDGQGRRLDVTDASGRLTRMSYDREGRLTQVARDPNGLNLRTVTSYDAAGRVLTVTEGYGTSAATTVQYAYDALNRRVAETVDPGTGKLNLITRYAYDANDNLVTRTDALGNLTRYAYDEAGRLRFVVDAAGALVETVYDKNGNAVLTREYAKALSAGALAALAAAPTTGALQALVTSESLLNNAADRLGYQVFDRDNRVRFTLDAAGSLTETRYDSAGRVQQTLAYGALFTSGPVLTKLRAGTAAVSDFTGFASANESAARASQYVYDAAGRVVYALTRSDAGAVVSERRYDASGLKTADVAYAVTIPYVAGQTAAQVASALATAGGNAADQQRLTRYAYDGAGRLRFSVDDAGAVTEQRYDGADRVVSTHAYATPVTIATVTEAAVAALVAGQVNVQRTGYAYDNAGRLTGTTDALNKTESYGYDAAGRRTSVTNKLGAVWTYEYDAAGRMTAERSPAVAVARYDASGNVVVSTTSIVTRRTYDALGQVLTVTENAGTAEERTVTYEYDVRGRQSRTLFPDAWQLDDNGVLAATGVQPDVRVAYDALDRAVVQKDVRGNYSYKVYDSLGRLAYDIDEAGYVTAYAYDAYGEQTGLTRYANKLNTAKLTGWTAGQAITRAQMAGSGVLTASADDRTLTTIYDRLGRKSAITQPSVAYYKADGTLATGTPTTRFEYDAYGNLVKERQLLEGTPDQADAVWADTFHYYDELGRRIRTVDAEGYVTAWQYDALGRVELQIEFARKIETAGLTTGTLPPLPAVGNAATGYDRSTLWSYDLLGRKVKESASHLYQTAAGANERRMVDTAFGYDAEGRLLTTTVDGVKVSGIAYDALGRTLSTTETEHKVLRSDWQSLLAGNANLDLSSAALYVDAAPYTTMDYDAFGNALRVVRYAGGDPASGAPNAGDAANAVTTVRYDRQGRAVATRDAVGTFWYSRYDAADNVVDAWYTLTGASGNMTVHTVASYDAIGRQLTSVTTRTPAGGGAALTDAQSAVAYNAFGEITAQGATAAALASAATSARYVYDKAGRVVASNADTGANRSYFYDLAGHQVREERPWTNDGAAATAVYLTKNDKLGRVIGQVLPSWKVDASATAQVSVSLDRWGNVLVQTDPLGNVTQYAYNDRDQVIRQTAPSVKVIDETGAERWQAPETRWMYDALGRLIATQDANGHVRRYEYDAAGQQVRVTDATGGVSRKGYDVLGREVAAQDAVGYLTYVDYDKLDHAVAQGDFLPNGSARAKTVLQSYLLDQNGGRLQTTDATGSWIKYDYDSRGLLVRSQTKAGVVRASAYDAQGRKIRETIASDSNTWVYDYFGRLTDHVDMGGSNYDYAYDARSGLLTAVTGFQPMGLMAMQGGEGSGYVMPMRQQLPPEDWPDLPPDTDLTQMPVNRRTEYYANGLVMRVTDGPITYYYEYDASGNRTLEATQTVDGAGNQVHTITRTTYDSHNRIIRVTNQDMAAGGKYTLDLSYDYDAVGNRRRVVANSAYGTNAAPLDPTNQAPVVAAPIPDQTAPANGSNWSFVVPANTFTDPEGGTLTYSATGLPDWLHFDAATRTFSGVPQEAGSWSVTVIAQDAKGASGTDTFNVTTPNVAPTVSSPIPDQTVNANQVWRYTIPANTFADRNGQELICSVDGKPSWITFDPATRTFSGTSPTSGTWAITVTANDGSLSVSDTFTVAIGTSSNRSPVVSNPIPDQAAPATGGAWSYTFPPTTFTDPDGSALTYTASGMPAWMAFDASTRKFSGTPKEVGSWSITVIAQDPQGANVTDTFIVTTPNAAPTVSSPIPDQTANASQAWSYTVPAGTFSDRNGQALSFEVSGRPPWAIFNPDTRTFSGVAPTSGSWSITVTASDGDLSVSDTFTLTVLGPNQVPVVANPIPDQNAQATGGNWSFVVPANTFNDPDGGALTYSTGALPQWLHFDAASRTFSGTLSTLGSWNITVTAQDPRGGTVSDTFTVTVIAVPNQAPVVSNAIPDQTATASQTWSYTLPANTFSDPNGDPLTYDAWQWVLVNGIQAGGGSQATLMMLPPDDPEDPPGGGGSYWTEQPLPSWLSFNAATRTFTGTPPAQGSLQLRVWARDGRGGAVSDTFTLTINPVPNRAPVVSSPIPDQGGTAGQAWSYVFPANTFSDPDGNALTYTASGMPPGVSFTASTRKFSGTPTAAGSWNVTVTARDPSGATVSDTFVVTIAAANQAPVVSNAIPDQTATTGQAWSYTLPANTFTDPNGDALTYDAWQWVLVNGIQAGGGSQATLMMLPPDDPEDPPGGGGSYWTEQPLPSWLSFNAATRTFTGTPPAQGSLQLRVWARDGRGGAVSDTFTLTINPIPNRAPVVSSPIPDQSGTVGQAWNYVFPANAFSDPDGNALTYTASGMPPGVSFTASTRKFSGTPTAAGSWNVTVTARDPSGATVSDTFVVTIAAANQPPVVSNAIPDRTANAGSAWSYTLPANTFTDPNGDALTYDAWQWVLVNGIQAGGGSQATLMMLPPDDPEDPPGGGGSYWTEQPLPSWLSFNAATRTFTGTPPAQGSLQLRVWARDGRGGAVSDTFTLTIGAPLNRAPVVSAPIPDQSASAGQAWSYAFPANTFSDPDGNALTYTASGMPPGVSFTASTRTFSGAPTAAGSWSVTVTAKDPSGASVSDIFTVTVSSAPATNHAPYVNRPLEDQPSDFGLYYTFAADTFVDPDGDTLTYTHSVSPASSLIHFDAATRTFSGSPPGGKYGKDYRITVTASDGRGQSVSASFTYHATGTMEDPLGGLERPYVRQETLASQTSNDLYGMLSAGALQVELDQQAVMMRLPDDPTDPGDPGDPPGGGGGGNPPAPKVPNVQTLWFSYDAENRVQVVNGTLVNGQIVVAGKQANSDVESYALHYDAAGHAVSRTTVTSWGATQVAQSTYTLRGQLELEYAAVNVGQTTGVVAKHTYDAAGRETELTEYFAPGTIRSYLVGNPKMGEQTEYEVDVSGWRSHQTKTTYDVDGRVLQVSELGRTGQTWFRGAPDPALTALSTVFYSTASGGSGYNSAGMLVTYRYQTGSGTYTHTYTTEYAKRETYLEKTVTGTSTDPNYKRTVTTSIYDQMGRRVKITQSTPGQSVPTQVRSFSFDASGGILTRRDNGSPQHYVYVNGQQVATLGEDGKIDAASQLTAFDSSQMGTEPAMVLEGDTLQSIAQRVYGNGSLWYVLAAANAVTDAELVVGSTLKVPSVKTTANDATTFKPFDPNAIQGSTTPSLPYITPPPKHHCNALVTVLIVVVAIVVAVYTAGAASGAMTSAAQAAAGSTAAATGATATVSTGLATATVTAAGTVTATGLTTAGAMLAGAAGGIAGSIASQAVGSAMGATSFSWRSVAAAGITGALTAGLTASLQGSSAFTNKLGDLNKLGRVMQGVGNYGSSVVANAVVGRDTNFSWASVAATAVGSYVSAKLNPSGTLPLTKGTTDLGRFVNDFGGNYVNGAFAATSRRLFGQGEQNWGQLAVDAFGNALGNAVVRRLQSSRNGKFEITKETIEQERLQLDPGKLELIPPTGLAGESLGSRGGASAGSVGLSDSMAGNSYLDPLAPTGNGGSSGQVLDTWEEIADASYRSHATLYPDAYGTVVPAFNAAWSYEEKVAWYEQHRLAHDALPAHDDRLLSPSNNTHVEATTNASVIGITDAAVDADIAAGHTSSWDAASYALRYTGYQVWNFASLGFLKRHDERLTAQANGQLSDANFWTATTLDAVGSVASLYVGGRVGGYVTGRLGNGYAGFIGSGAAGAGAFDLMQQTTGLGIYTVTQGQTGQSAFSWRQLTTTTAGGALLGGAFRYAQGSQLLNASYTLRSPVLLESRPVLSMNGMGAIKNFQSPITRGRGLGFQNLEYKRYRTQGFSSEQARYLTEPYPASGMGHHFIGRQHSLSRGGWVPESIVESPLNIMGRGMSRGSFYERHFLGDPYFFGTAFPRRIGGTWSGSAAGLVKPMRPLNLWHAAPNWVRNTGIGSVGAGAAWGAYEVFNND